MGTHPKVTVITVALGVNVFFGPACYLTTVDTLKQGLSKESLAS